MTDHSDLKRAFSSIVHVTDADVKRLLPFSKAIDLVREAYLKFARAEALNPPRVMLTVPHGASMYFMPAHILGQRSVIVKVARVNPENSRVSLPSVLLNLYMYDAITGEPVAEIEGECLTAIRTAASSAVATDLLAEDSPSILGVYGSGTQAASHIQALLMVRDFDKVIVYSRDKRRREEFAEKMTRECDMPIMALDSPDRVAEESDVITTATTSAIPIFNGNRAKPGTHVNAIGSAAPETREVDTNLVRRSRVIVDSRSQALSTYGDVITPIREGAILESDILELGELLNYDEKLARKPGDLTLFKSGGVAVLDAIIADHVVESLARAKGLG